MLVAVGGERRWNVTVEYPTDPVTDRQASAGSKPVTQLRMSARDITPCPGSVCGVLRQTGEGY